MKNSLAAIKAKQPLTATHLASDNLPDTQTSRREVALEFIKSVGKSLAPAAQKPLPVIDALSTIATLADLSDKENLVRAYILARALVPMSSIAISSTMPETTPFISAPLNTPLVHITTDLNDPALATVKIGLIVSDLPLQASSKVAVYSLQGTPHDFTLTMQSNGFIPTQHMTFNKLEDFMRSLCALFINKAPVLTNNFIKPVQYEVKPWTPPKTNPNAIYETYPGPARFTTNDAKPHPTPLVETAALATVPPPEPRYVPILNIAALRAGFPSDAQLEMIIQAGQAHLDFLPADPGNQDAPAPRAGYFVGAGTGTGKTLVQAGTIADNWHQGRTRHIFVSENTRLMKGLEHALHSLQVNIPIFFQNEFSAGMPIPPSNGILFTTYSTIRATDENEEFVRLQQIIDWAGQDFDGVLALDEVQNLENADPSRPRGSKGENGINFGTKSASKQGLAGIELQTKLPGARVLYSSATGADKLEQLSFAPRLGLWGPGTSFKDRNAFIEQMSLNGIAGLEVVISHLKAMGRYTAITLSFDGVTYERIEHHLTDNENQTYEAAAEAWRAVQKLLDESLATLGYVPTGKNGNTLRAVKHRFQGQFTLSRQRFFSSLLTSLMTTTMVRSIEKELAAGNTAVVQIHNTSGAQTNRALDKAGNDDADTLADLDLSPKEIITNFVKNNIPTYRVKYNAQTKEYEVIYDAAGHPVLHTEFDALKRSLLAKLEPLTLPKGALDIMTDAFGTLQLAEVTGRDRRVVPTGGLPISATNKYMVEQRTRATVESEIREFQDDRRRILVFSSAGGVGDNYDANEKFKNQRKRVHYLLQVGWRVKTAFQGMGRTHRTGQIIAPTYRLMGINVPGHQRFVTAIAKGLESLGALTRGARQANSQSLFSSRDNLTSTYAEKGWNSFIQGVFERRYADFTQEIMFEETNLKLSNDKGEFIQPRLTTFLNRMMAMTPSRQRVLFAYLEKEIDDVYMKAVAEGTLDRGAELINTESAIKVDELTIYTHPQTFAETKLISALVTYPTSRTTFAEAQRILNTQQGATIQYMVNTYNYVGMYAKVGQRLEDGVLVATYKVLRPTRPPVICTFEDIADERWMQTSEDRVQQFWDRELAAASQTAEETIHMATGAVLNVWHKIPNLDVRLARIETDDGDQYLGRIVTPNFVAMLKQGVAQTSLDAATIFTELSNGQRFDTTTGWKLRPNSFSRSFSRAVEIVIPTKDRVAALPFLQQVGAHVESDAFGFRFFLDPNDNDKTLGTLAQILQSHPVDLSLSSNQYTY